jgi:hypothetical protein
LLTSYLGKSLLGRKIKTNKRLKETERFIKPPPPEEDKQWQNEIASSPLLSKYKQDASGYPIPEVRKNIELPSHQSLNHTMVLRDPKRPNNKEIKNIADRLGFTLNSKVNNSYEMFKFFDKDNDG